MGAEYFLRIFMEIEQLELIDSDEAMLLPKEQALRVPGYTLERVAKDEGRYKLLVRALATGMPIRQICTLYRVHAYTLERIATKEASSIEALKRQLGARALQCADYSMREYLHRLSMGIVETRDLLVAAGIFSEKGLLLMGQPTAISHSLEVTGDVDAWNGFWRGEKQDQKDSSAIEVDAVVETSGRPAPERTQTRQLAAVSSGQCAASEPAPFDSHSEVKPS